MKRILNEKNKIALATITALSLLGSCKALKNAETAANNSGRAANTSEEIKEYNQQTMEAMKMGAALETREREYKEALEANDFLLKTTHTSPYFQSMSFQLLGVMKKNSIDLEFTRQKQEADAIKEFVRKMSQLLPNEFDEQEPSGLEKSNEMQTLYAFAVAMHEITTTQYNNLKNQKADFLQVESFLDVVMKTLAKRPADLKGQIARENLSFAEKEALREYDKLIYILKVRYMALPVLALGRMCRIPEMGKVKGLIEKIKMRYDIPLIRKAHWKIKKNLSSEQINYINDYFDRARTTKAFLESIGEKVTVDNDIREIFTNLELDPNLEPSDENGAEKIKAFEGLKQRLNEL